MFFTSKKKKMQQYLAGKPEGEKDAFDFLLSEYLGGAFQEALTAMGIGKISIHIDWLKDTKCIGVQGMYRDYYMDLQIDPEEFSVSFDRDEPDEGKTFPLQNKEQFYHVLSETIKAL